MSEFRMYQVVGNLRTTVSESLSPGDPGYNPVDLDVDSTNLEPQPSGIAKIEVELDGGYYTNSFSLTFEGTNSNYWEMTDTDPVADAEALWYSGLSGLSIANGETLPVWVRAKTFFEETPATDTSVKIVPEGRVEAV